MEQGKLKIEIDFNTFEVEMEGNITGLDIMMLPLTMMYTIKGAIESAFGADETEIIMRTAGEALVKGELDKYIEERHGKEGG
jgi:hypothetical protein